MGVGKICVSKLNYSSSGTVTPAQVFAEHSETVNCAVSTSRLVWYTPARPASHLLTYLHSTGPLWPHYVSMSGSVFMFWAWCLTTTDRVWPFSDLCGNQIIPRPHWGQKNTTDGQRVRECYLDHFVAMRLRISSRHGEDSDLLRLGATVSQRQGHLPVGGAVCGVGPGNTEDHQCHI